MIDGRESDDLYRILWLDAHHRLLNASHLGEFHAIVADDLASSMLDGYDALRPGQSHAVEVDVLRGIRDRLAQRSYELRRMLENGGVLVVRLRQFSGLHVPASAWSAGEVESLRFADWWMPAIPSLANLAAANLPIIHVTSGHIVAVSEPDHVFEPYLASSRYSAFLDPIVFTWGGTPRPLAANPVGDVVACESNYGEGLVLVVQADGDLDALRRCLNDLLLMRRAGTDQWQLREEAALVQRDKELRTQLIRDREDALAKMREIRTAKRPIFDDGDVQRILALFRKATDETTSGKRTLELLHRLVEIVEDRAGGERGLITALGISKSTVESIKHPANDPRLDVRHATVGQPSALETEQVSHAIDAARQIVHGFIEHLYRTANPEAD
jgi:hypothetical protein